jgi:hypothetical protein
MIGENVELFERLIGGNFYVSNDDTSSCNDESITKKVGHRWE